MFGEHCQASIRFSIFEEYLLLVSLYGFEGMGKRDEYKVCETCSFTTSDSGVYNATHTLYSKIHLTIQTVF